MGMYQLFSKVPYLFLKLDQVHAGNIVVEEIAAEGVFQRRDGYSQFDNLEIPTADAQLWISPNESFITTLNKQLVGHGVRVDGENYRITAMIEGKDQDIGIIDNYTLDLKRERISTWETSVSPLT